MELMVLDRGLKFSRRQFNLSCFSVAMGGGSSKALSLGENRPDFRYEFVGLFGVRIHA